MYQEALREIRRHNKKLKDMGDAEVVIEALVDAQGKLDTLRIEAEKAEEAHSARLATQEAEYAVERERLSSDLATRQEAATDQLERLNAKYLELQATVAKYTYTHEMEIADNEEKLAGVQAAVTQAETQLTGIKHEVALYQSELEALRSRLIGN